MVTICQKCGDAGFNVALIYCDKCQENAEHRYCLDVMPKTFTEYVTWFCEDCKPQDSLKVSSKRSKKFSKSSKKKRLSCKSKLRSSLYSTTEEGDSKGLVVGLESSHSGQPLGGHCLQSHASGQAVSNGAMDIDEVDKSTMPDVRPYINSDTEQSKQNMDHIMLTTSTSEVLDRNAFVLSQPIYEPVWRGCFKLCVRQFGIVDGMAAHLSSKACLQVYEEAQLLSESLCPEILPRLNIWPKGFIKSGPKDENIALYFFPQNESFEKEYAILVDYMIENDLAMKAAGANADLLIFTSTELPLSIWKFQAKYYLWGVFRGRDSSSSGSASNQDLTCKTAEIAAGNEGVNKSHTRRSPHSPLSNGSSHGSASL